ncbi:MAG: class I SAM-dependent methyltransferase [Prochlorotrichaceae cyanobacterium]
MAIPSPSPENHWQQDLDWWHWLGPPLRPHAEDLRFIQQWIRDPLNQWVQGKGTETHQDAENTPLQIGLLGVTPELAILDWPEQSCLTAIDSSEKMINAVWVGDRPHRKVIRGDWRSLPFEPQSCHAILGDGCLTLLDYPQGYQAIFQELARVLHPQGLISLRCFVRPEIPESVDSIFADLWTSKIETFHGFKLRLAMALQQNLAKGVAMVEVWNCWQQSIADPTALFETLHWPQALESTIAMYQNSTARYTFPTRLELQQIMANAGFQEKAVCIPTYDLGDRCPTLILQLRQS